MEENNKERKAYFNDFINCLLVIGRIAVVLFCVLMCQAVNAQVELGHQKKYYDDFPYNIQPSELDINCKISQVEYTTHELEYKFGEFQTGRQIESAVYQYNANGQLIRFYEEKYGKSYHDWKLQYDANGKIVYPNNYFYENGKLSKVIWGDVYVRMHYVNGVLNQVISYTDDGEELFTVFYQNGDAIKQVTPPKSWNRNQVTTRTYSYYNHKLTKGDGETYTYNAKGLVSRMVDRHRKIVNDYEFITGSNGQGTKVVEDIYEYTYEFDSKGNWIKRTCTQKDENGYIKKGKLTVRKITYGSGSSTSQNTGSSNDSNTLLTQFIKYCEQNDWDKAYNLWTVLFKKYPDCSTYLYGNYGETIVKGKIDIAKTDQERQAWIDTLMMVHDRRFKYYDKSKYDEGFLLGRKGYDLLKYKGRSMYQEAYNILKKSIDLQGKKSEYRAIAAAIAASMIMYGQKQISLSELTNDYEQYKKLIPLLDGYESEREDVYKLLSDMYALINR